VAEAVVPEEAAEPLPPPVAAPGAKPIREVLASHSFRRYWVAQFLSALGNGSLRFVFVWLVLDLSDSNSAAGFVGMALGLPALLVTMPAGAASDRMDRRRMIITGELAAAAVLGVAAAAVWAGVMSVPLAALFAAALGGLLAWVAPALQALVPSLVPPHRLMTGVALQGMGMNAALLFGAVVGGGTIAVAGVGGAFAVLGVLQVLAALAMSRVHLDAREQAPRRGMRGDIGDGLRFALGHEPVRSLLGVGLLAGLTWGVVTILLPEMSKDVLGRGAFATSLLFAALGVGLFGTSMVLASRHHIARPGLLIATAISIGLGGGVLAMGLSRSYVLTLVVMLLWGVGGGTSMTLQRGLIQRHTPHELMGRMMALTGLALLGSFPLAAGIAAALTATLGPADGLVATGAVVLGLAIVLGLRKPLRAA
jgi:MFS family permease